MDSGSTQPQEEGEDSDDDYEQLGWYLPGEAHKLLKRFDDGGIAAVVEDTKGDDNWTTAVNLGWGRFGMTELLISIPRDCHERALEIHKELFGDGM